MYKFEKIKSDFLINPEITYLNFGSFGACPKPIFDEYQRWQRVIEFEPVQFIAVNASENLEKSRKALAQYINCNKDELVLVSNPSYAVNIIAKSLQLNKGDEILSTDLEYGACDRAWNYYCDKAGAKFIRTPITLPVKSKEELIEEFWKGYSKHTKAIFISQITSTTAMKFPVKEICDMAKERGLLTFVDGAHVPGHVPLDLADLKADIYTGACHKWMMTPKGCSFLYVKHELQHLFDPLVISWGYKSASPSHSQFLDYHQMQGTRDFSAFLTIPKAIEYMKENNWNNVADDCAALARNNYQKFCDLFHTQPLCPINNYHLGQMCSVRINTIYAEQIQNTLFRKYKIEIPVMKHNGNTFIRYSINAFNSQFDLDILYAALKDIISETDWIKV